MLNDENSVINEIIKGNKGAYDYLIERYKNKLFAVVLRMTLDVNTAERLVEACFLDVYDNLANYKEYEDFSEWFYRQAIPMLIKELSCFTTNASTDKPYIDFFNPYYIEIEESIVSISPENRLEFLINRIMGIEFSKLAIILGTSETSVKNSYYESLDHIRKQVMKKRDSEQGKDCLPLSKLTSYYDETLNDTDKISAEDHLEFCPSCREVLDSMKKEKLALETVIETPRLDTDFNRCVLSKLDPYIKKKARHRTWKYQLGVTAMIAAIFMFSVFVVPSIKPFANMVTTYMKYGTVYNVWTEGTYIAKEREISFEVTGVEIDALHMVVYYDIQNERSNTNRNMNFGYDDFDYYQYEVVQIVDEEGKTYPAEVASPFTGMDYGMNGNAEALQEELERDFIIVKANTAGELPDKFTLRFNIKQIQGTYGNWKLDVPIHYDKVEKDIEIVELNELVKIDDKVEIELLSMKYGQFGSRLTYHVRQTEEEKQRIETLLKENGQESRIQEFTNHPQVHAGIHIVNEENYHMVPLYFHHMYMHEADKPIEQDFSRYYLDIDSYELKGKEEEFGKYVANIMGIHYNEPAFISLSIPLKETEKQPLNIDLDGLKLKDINVKTLAEGSNERERFEIIVTAEKTKADIYKHYSWEFVNEEGHYIETYYRDMYYSEMQPLFEPFNLMHVEIPRSHNQPGVIVLKADYSYTNFVKEEGWEMPLYKKN